MARVPFDMNPPFGRFIGMRGLHREPGRVVVGIDLEPHHCNSGGYSHGGVVMTMLDVAMSVAAKSAAADITDVLTIEMKVNMMATARGSFEAEGWVVKGGKSIAFMEGEARDANGEIVARAMGTWRLRRAKGGD